MSKREQEDWLEDEEELEILSDEAKSSKEYESAGWKFYLKLKDLLPDWWREFNGEVTYRKHKGSMNHHRCIESFAKKKLKDKLERKFFIWMVSPKKVWEQEALSKHGNKKRVPWLGDWEAKRKNGYWLTNRALVGSLRKAVRENLESGKAIRATAPFIIQVLMRRQRLVEKINEKFQGEPFYADERLDSKNNQRRVNTYRKMLLEAESDIFGAIHEWMRIHGVNPKNPHEMADMATLAALSGQVGASAALTGMTAGLNMQPIPGQNGSHLLTTGDGNNVVVSLDALMLAAQLRNHESTFKRPLPVIEAEEVPKKEKTNGHAKHAN
jgi:hypothetical protein